MTSERVGDAKICQQLSKLIGRNDAMRYACSLLKLSLKQSLKSSTLEHERVPKAWQARMDGDRTDGCKLERLKKRERLERRRRDLRR